MPDVSAARWSECSLIQVPSHVMPDDRSSRRVAPLAPDDRRAAIIGTVSDLVTERGAAVTSKELADAAGVSEGTIFKAFGSKCELFAAVVADRLDQSRLDEAIVAVPPGDPVDMLIEIVTILQQRTIGGFQLLERLGPEHIPRHDQPLPVSAALVRHFDTHGPALRCTAEEAARTLRGVAFGQTHPLLVDEPMDPAEIVRLFLYGCAEVAS